MISILSNLEVYGSPPALESTQGDNHHHWVAVINKSTCHGFFVLTICSKCGCLARKNNSIYWELCRLSGDRWKLNSESLNKCPGYLEEVN